MSLANTLDIGTNGVDGDFGHYTQKALQNFLASNKNSDGVHYNPGPIDGNMGDVTAKAFQFFLRDQGFDPGPIDGKIRDGSGPLKGSSTKAVQKWLKSKGFSPGPEDGRWGTLTVVALQRFLKDYRMVGPVTVKLHQLFGVAGNAKGHVCNTIRMMKGHTSSKSIEDEVFAKVTSEAGVSLDGLTSKLSSELSSQIKTASSWSNQAQYEEKVEIKCDFDKPCFVYQTELNFRLDDESVKVGGMSIIQRDRPINTNIQYWHEEM